MQFRKVSGGYLVRLEKGEETNEQLSAFAATNKIPCGFLQGIGAVRNLKIGYFDIPAKKYRTKNLRGAVEVISLSGNISYLDGRPFVHAHIAVADKDNRMFGGHLFKAEVAVTLEIFIQTVNKKLSRKLDPANGFNFWQL